MVYQIESRRALLLQGPAGPFFRHFASELKDAGTRVIKVNFHGGDEYFYPEDAIAYRGSSDEWSDTVNDLLGREDIDSLFLFGDCRPIHKAAIARAQARGVAVWVFEEGYLRPDYITLERDGVNGYSRLPRQADFYLEAAADLPDMPRPMATGQTFARHAYFAARNAIACTRAQGQFPNYRHHRPLGPRKHTTGWVWGGMKKLAYARLEAPVFDKCLGPWSGRYFLMPIQVHADYQILEHSSFASVEESLEQVVASFAAHAPSDMRLLLKHHPMDRGYRDYGAFLRRLRHRFMLGERLVSIHDLHLPTLLKHARGLVTVNSTVGLSALHHQVPVKVLGNAIYDFAAMTDQQPLDTFWYQPKAPDADVYRAFSHYLRWTNQHNGSFYRRLFARGAGIHWTAAPVLDTRKRASEQI